MNPAALRPFSVFRSVAASSRRLTPSTATKWTVSSSNSARIVVRSNATAAAQQAPKPNSPKFNRRIVVAGAVTAGILSAFALARFTPLTSAEAPPQIIEHNQDEPTRHFRLDEVRKHDGKGDSFWVYSGDRVYDITEWVPNHPGGAVILRALGGSIDPYWNIFTIHKKQDVYDILEQYFIGKIDPRDLVDGKPPGHQIDDPFESDPARDPAFVVHTPKPCNAETPEVGLEDFITPTRLFYVRNHFWVPTIEDPSEWKLTIELPDGEEVAYSLKDLRTRFKQHTITATLQCSGNRRKHMSEGCRKTNGLPWSVGAISNAEWTGVRLRDVLADAGFDVGNCTANDVKHAHFSGSEAYAASIPIEKACDRNGDVLLAHSMNGEDISPDHGYPLRALVPGTVAARSVKWLNKIVLAEDESPSQWQRRDYKCFGPNEEKPDWDAAPSIQETPVQSAITSISRIPADRLKTAGMSHASGLENMQADDREGDQVLLHGYAFSGGGRRIVRVDVSADDGKTWQQANLPHHEEKGSKVWCWQQWDLAVPASKLSGHFVVKAVDDGYNTQPEEFAPIYNPRGNLANAWHRVPVDFGLARAAKQIEA